MLSLNLLPPQIKQERRIGELYLLVKNLIFVILITTAVAAMILLISRAMLENHFNRIVAETTLTTKYTNFFSQELKAFKQRLTSVQAIQQQFVPWSAFIISFSHLIPPDIAIYSIHIQPDPTNPITIRGFARSREKLLELKANLERSQLFPDVVEIPLENLLQKDNIEFSITTNLTTREFDVLP